MDCKSTSMSVAIKEARAASQGSDEGSVHSLVVEPTRFLTLQKVGKKEGSVLAELYGPIERPFGNAAILVKSLK